MKRFSLICLATAFLCLLSSSAFSATIAVKIQSRVPLPVQAKEVAEIFQTYFPKKEELIRNGFCLYYCRHRAPGVVTWVHPTKATELDTLLLDNKTVKQVFNVLADSGEVTLESTLRSSKPEHFRFSHVEKPLTAEAVEVARKRATDATQRATKASDAAQAARDAEEATFLRRLKYYLVHRQQDGSVKILASDDAIKAARNTTNNGKGKKRKADAPPQGKQPSPKSTKHALKAQAAAEAAEAAL